MNSAERIEQLGTGIQGFDHISMGGVPRGRCTLVTGTSGSGKTVFGVQYLIAGVREFDEPGVIVTFEESPHDMTRNALAIGWDLEKLVEEEKLAIVDATPDADVDVLETGRFDLNALMARIEHAITRTSAKRVTIDAIGALLTRFGDPQSVRYELYRIAVGLKRLGVTTLITVERTDEDGEVARFGVEEFVADNVIILRNRLENEKRRRTIEILKFRGATHHKGEYPFTIDSEEGVVVIPLSAVELTQRSSGTRVSSGNPILDDMCGGGLFRDSINLASGATGTGKTLMVTEFMKAAIDSGGPALLFAYEESREQLCRNAANWGVDFEEAEEKGLLKIVSRYPEAMGLEDHLISMKREIRNYKPTRVAIDSVSALERVGTQKSFREFVIGVTSHIKHLEIVGLFTNTTSMFIGAESITEAHISSITDSIVLLRYVELHGQMRRGITVLKMRGSWHEKQIREYVIDSTGMNIKEAFVGVNGILMGAPTADYNIERGHLGQMFEQQK